MTDKPFQISDETLAEAEYWQRWVEQEQERVRQAWLGAQQLAAQSRTPQQLCADFDALAQLLGPPLMWYQQECMYECPVCHRAASDSSDVRHHSWCRWIDARNLINRLEDMQP